MPFFKMGDAKKNGMQERVEMVTTGKNDGEMVESAVAGTSKGALASPSTSSDGAGVFSTIQHRNDPFESQDEEELPEPEEEIEIKVAFKHLRGYCYHKREHIRRIKSIIINNEPNDAAERNEWEHALWFLNWFEEKITDVITGDAFRFPNGVFCWYSTIWTTYNGVINELIDLETAMEKCIVAKMHGGLLQAMEENGKNEEKLVQGMGGLELKGKSQKKVEKVGGKREKSHEISTLAQLRQLIPDFFRALMKSGKEYSTMETRPATPIPSTPKTVKSILRKRKKTSGNDAPPNRVQFSEQLEDKSYYDPDEALDSSIHTKKIRLG